jgi:hypothetical protein
MMSVARDRWNGADGCRCSSFDSTALRARTQDGVGEPETGGDATGGGVASVTKARDATAALLLLLLTLLLVVAPSNARTGVRRTLSTTTLWCDGSKASPRRCRTLKRTSETSREEETSTAHSAGTCGDRRRPRAHK